MALWFTSPLMRFSHFANAQMYASRCDLYKKGENVTMKVTNIEAVRFVNTVAGLKDKKLPVTLLFAMRHNANLLMKSQIEAYETSRKELVDEQGMISQESIADYNTLLNEAVEQSLKMIRFSDLSMIDNGKYDPLTYEELNNLSIMFKE